MIARDFRLGHNRDAVQVGVRPHVSFKPLLSLRAIDVHDIPDCRNDLPAAIRITELATASVTRLNSTSTGKG